LTDKLLEKDLKYTLRKSNKKRNSESENWLDIKFTKDWIQASTHLAGQNHTFHFP